jgi:hypothetical protein
MNARTALALTVLAGTALCTLSGCASSTPAPVAPSPVVAFAVPVHEAEPRAPIHYELQQLRMYIPAIRAPGPVSASSLAVGR